MTFDDLTAGQQREMLCLARASQPTFGKGRARIQNALRALGLVIFVDDGWECRLSSKGRELMSAAPGAGGGKEV